KGGSAKGYGRAKDLRLNQHNKKD
ncbi:hypothetical protein LCGC14_3106120, partial [marine sediment metagenome]